MNGWELVAFIFVCVCLGITLIFLAVMSIVALWDMWTSWRRHRQFCKDWGIKS